jgi:phosphonate metabolism protein (transferase hexapeptide repeat family)
MSFDTTQRQVTGGNGNGASATRPDTMRYIEAHPERTAEEMEQFMRSRQGRLGEEPYIHPTAMVHKSRIGSWTALGPNCSLRECSFGDYSYAAGNVHIVWSEIGNFCSIASQVRINPGNHPHWRVTQNHCTYRRVSYRFDSKDDEAFFDWRRSNSCRIGHDVWIGHGATIMPGAQVGIGAVVGAGAVVPKAHPIGPYEIAVGVPARTIRKRFSDDVIEKLLAIEYWYWDRETLEDRFDDLCDIDVFLEKYAP